MDDHSGNGNGKPPRPSPHGGGRGGDGRFVAGNKFGRGNPLAGRASRIRAVLLRKMSPAVAGRIADRLIAQAQTGDMVAIRELLDRTIGKPSATELLERVEQLEARIGVDS